MTAPSPVLAGPSLVTFTIKVNGKAIDSAWQVDSIDTWTAVNKLPRARLVLFDGSPAAGDFPISSVDTLLPGNKVEIAAGYGGKESVIFTGVIVRQGLSIDQTEASKLIVELTGQAIRMTLERRNALFEKITDKALIEKLIKANGLSADVADTGTEHEEIVQYYAADWDLMVLRAEMNGLVVIADGGKVTVKAPDTTQSPVLAVTYGNDMLDLDLEMDAATQYAASSIKSYAWDPSTQRLLEAGPGSVEVKEAGNVSSAQLAKVFNVTKFTQQTAGPVEKTALQEWSAGELLKSKLAKIRGTVRFQGSAKARVGKMLELAGLGHRFNGPVFISGVRHRISDGAWLTTVEVGLSGQWFASEAPRIAAPMASGQMPSISGLQTGIVKSVKDPAGEFRVQVSLPLLQDPKKLVWARLGTFYASDGCGALVYPEVRDEVIVGFMNDDPRYPVILGSVYSKVRKPVIKPDAENTKKLLTTRSKLQISFDDKDKVLEITTPGGQSIALSDKAGSIVLKDSNRNTVTLGKSGIALESGSNVNIKAKGNISLEAGANLKLTATANATMEGLQISHSAKTKLTAKGTLTTEVSASGLLTLKGALVKIN